MSGAWRPAERRLTLDRDAVGCPGSEDGALHLGFECRMLGDIEGMKVSGNRLRHDSASFRFRSRLCFGPAEPLERFGNDLNKIKAWRAVKKCLLASVNSLLSDPDPHCAGQAGLIRLVHYPPSELPPCERVLNRLALIPSKRNEPTAALPEPLGLLARHGRELLHRTTLDETGQ